MKVKNVRWFAAGLVAFLMGFPVAEEARADDAENIVDAVRSLITVIIDAAGNS
ncbi:MAG: hypothetical protein JXQ75_08430 [Phycisphaerae bacterium]|nr:hypothetical protein [Phycisphaerae bacterium]